MKPRFEPKNVNFDALMKEALELENRLIEKASPNYTQKEGSMQGQERFMTVTGGGKPNVQSTGYTTNNSVPEVEDVKNKGAISEKSNVLDKNPHYPTALSTLDSHFNQAGGEGPVMKSVGGSIERIQVQDLKKSVDRLARRLE
tara:strand:+ start:1739 stop:2167 length:429 start_codon:yes stop_codon:yes gene_type:complete